MLRKLATDLHRFDTDSLFWVVGSGFLRELIEAGLAVEAGDEELISAWPKL